MRPLLVAFADSPHPELDHFVLSEDLHSHIGVGAAPGMRGNADTNSIKAPILPWLRSIDGFNTHDLALNNTILGGVTTMLVLRGFNLRSLGMTRRSCSPFPPRRVISRSWKRQQHRRAGLRLQAQADLR